MQTAERASPRAAGRANPDLERRYDRITLIAGCLTSFILSIWLTWGIWAPGVPAGEDTSAHLARADYAMQHFFSAGQLDGWQTSFGLGYQEFLFAGPGFSVLVALMKVLTFGLIGTPEAFKAAIVVSFITLPLAMAFVAWSFGLGLRVAGVVAPLTWVVSSGFGGAGLKGIFEGGLVPNQLGSTFFCLGLGGVVLIIRRPSTRRVIFTALAMTGALITHPIAAYILGFFVVAVIFGVTIEWFRANRSAVHAALATPAATQPRDAENAEDLPGSDDLSEDPESARALIIALREPRRRLFALAVAAWLTFGLSAFTVIPILMHPELKGENSDWGDLPLIGYLDRMFRGDYLFRPGIALMIIFGWLFLLNRARGGPDGVGRRRPQPLALTLVLTPITFLAIGRFAINTWPDNIVAIQMTNRGYAYAGLLAILPLAAMVAAPRRPASAAMALIGIDVADTPGAFARYTNALTPILLAVVLVLLPSHLGRDAVTTITPTPTFARLASEISQNVAPTDRFVTQREPGRERQLTGMPHPDLWLTAVTGRNTLNIFNLTASTVFGPVYEGEQLTLKTPEVEAAALARLGITYLALIDTDVTRNYLTSPRFHTIWSENRMAVLKVMAPDGQPNPASTATGALPITATRQDSDVNRFVVAVHAEQPTTVSIATAWSPKWTVTRNDEIVATEATDDNLLLVSVERGDSVLGFTYGPDRADALGRAITLLCLAGVTGALLLDRRRRRERTALAATTPVETPTLVLELDDLEAFAVASRAAESAAASDPVPRSLPAIGPESTEGVDPDLVVNIEGAAEFLQVEPAVVEQQLRAGTLPGRRLGDQWRLSKPALMAWLAEAVAPEPDTPGHVEAEDGDGNRQGGRRQLD